MFSALRSTTAAAAAPRACSRAFSTTPRAQLARMTVIGRLGAAPEEVPISGERTLVRYILATSHGKAEDKKTSWFRVASFVREGGQKEFLMGLGKGTLLYVDADARMDTYMDAEGNKRTSLSLISRNFEVLARARNEESAEHQEANEEGLV